MHLHCMTQLLYSEMIWNTRTSIIFRVAYFLLPFIHVHRKRLQLCFVTTHFTESSGPHLSKIHIVSKLRSQNRIMVCYPCFLETKELQVTVSHVQM